EGGQPRRLTTDAAEDVVPSWSRDGRWIYFTSQRSGSLQVWKMAATGGEAIQVTQQGGFEPLESPDGQWLYYARNRGSSAIWRMPVAGGAESFVFDFHQKNYSRLWTFSGAGLLFAAPISLTRASVKTFINNQERLVATLDCILRSDVSGLSLAPDGTALIFPVVPQRGSDLIMIENFR
ncbi:MAG: hypothetical protein HOP19_10715, partial [Acidobacteria bacterium]|nr:hypothetical protein [Acidobacteriota bacterium]